MNPTPTAISHENAAFWRKEPLNSKEEFLLNVTLDAHHRSAFRGNVSSQAVMFAALSSGYDYTKAITAGMMTLGGLHAPLVATCLLLKTLDPVSVAKAYAESGSAVPGWGNSFHKGVPDPEWMDVALTLQSGYPEMHSKLEAVTNYLQRGLGKNVFPNPSAYTAAVALVLGMPAQLSPHLLVLGRLTAWAEIFANPQV